MIKKSLMLIGGGLFFVLSAVAQNSWEKLAGPVGGIVYPLAIDHNDRLYALFNYTLFASADQGLTWTDIFNNAANFKMGRDACIYGESLKGKLYVSADWGATWSALPPTLAHLTLERMTIARDGTLYFANGDIIYISRDRGLKWTAVSFPLQGAAEQVWMSALDHLYVFGQNKLYMTTGDLDSLRLVFEAENSIRTVYETTRGDLFVAIDDAAVFKSMNKGQSWSRTKLPFVQSFYESPQGWLFGAGSANGKIVAGTSFISQNDGDTWNPIDVGFPVYTFAVSSEGKIYVGSDGLFISNDSGASFTNPTPPNAMVHTVLNAALNNLFCVTGIDKRYSRYWFSATNGESWIEIDKKVVFNQPRTFFNAKIVSQNRIWLLLGYSAGADTTVSSCVLYESGDGGRTWKSKRDFKVKQAEFDVDKSLPTIYVWIPGDKYFYRTDDFGAAWIPTTTPFEIGKLHAASKGLIYGYSRADVGKIRRLYFSSDKGNQWNYVDVPFESNSICRLAADRFGHVYKLAATIENESFYRLKSILRSTNFGQSFADVTPDSGSVLEPSSSMFCMATDLYGALYLNGANFVSKTRDNGTSWKEIYVATTGYPNIRCVHSCDGVNVYAGTFSNGIFKNEQAQLTFTPDLIDNLERPIAETYGVNWIDYDADGYEDIFLVNDGQNILYKNNKDGSFKRITSGSIVMDDEPSRSASWADYNNDGFIDCYVANGVGGGHNSLYKNNGDGTFKKITQGNIVEDFGDFRSCSWADVDNDGDLDLYITEVGEERPNILYINDGTNHFMKSNDIVVGEPADKTYCCAWCDFDNDGDLDIYLANQGPDKLFEQVRPREFALVSPARIAINEGAAVSCSWGDYNNDGFMDLFVVNYDVPNCLYRNNGNGSFTKENIPGICTDNKISKGSGWADYDNDGDLDLFVSNRNSFLFYANNGDGTFDKTPANEFIYHGGHSLALAWGDRENDGDLDLVIGSYDQQTLLYTNVSPRNNWIKIRCVGNKSNRSALGTKIVVKTTKKQLAQQVRHVFAQTGHAAQNSLTQHFGLGSISMVDSIIIQWPSGKRQVLVDKAANQLITVVEANTKVEEENDNSATPTAYKLAQNFPNPFNPTTTICFDIPRKSHIKIVVYDSRGQQIKILVDEIKSAGSHAVMWCGKDDLGVSVASGLYMYKLHTENFESVGKMTLLR